MGDEANERLKVLCDKIANERDPEKLAALARELDQWLAVDQELRTPKRLPSQSKDIIPES